MKMGIAILPKKPDMATDEKLVYFLALEGDKDLLFPFQKSIANAKKELSSLIN